VTRSRDGRVRRRNLVTLAILVALVVTFYVVFMIRAGNW